MGETQKSMDSLFNEINSYLSLVQQDLTRQLAVETPKRTGRASRGYVNVGKFDIRKEGEQPLIANKVPYVALLEEGRSKQAPRGMIEPALTKVARRNNKR